VKKLTRIFTTELFTDNTSLC